MNMSNSESFSGARKRKLKTNINNVIEDDLLKVINDTDDSSDEEDLRNNVDLEDEDIPDTFDELNLSDEDCLTSDSGESEDSDISDDLENGTISDDVESSDNDSEDSGTDDTADCKIENKSTKNNSKINDNLATNAASSEDKTDEAINFCKQKKTELKVTKNENYTYTNRINSLSIGKKNRKPRKKKVTIQLTSSNIVINNAKDSEVGETKDTLVNFKSEKVIRRNRVNNPKSRISKTKDNRLKEDEINSTFANLINDKNGDDTSDEEDLRNTIGNVPINWYDEYPHLGYGLDGLKIMKPAYGDKLDQFLDRLENPDYYRTVLDKQTGQQVKLSDEHLDFINRVMNHKVPDANYDLYKAFPDLYSHEVSEMPLSGRPEHKRSFIPSKAERQEVVRLATLIKKGLLRRRKLDPTVLEKEQPKCYDIWKPQNDDEKIMHITDHIPAPRMPLPGHQDSYNPPPEYLVNRHDEMALKGMKTEDRELFEGFWRKFKSIREIPGYPKFVKERFERLLDLYLTPRKRYRKVVAKSSDFLPNLPDKKDLRPYPTMEELIFKGHRSIIRTISIHPGGKYVASGSDDHTVKIWEISTGRCLRTFEVEEAPKTVSWNPNPKLFLVAVAMGRMIMFLNPENHLTDKLVVQQTNSIFKEEVDQGDYIIPEKIRDAINWRKPTEQEYANGYRLVLDHFKEVKQVVWHKQGDYFASVIPEGDHRSVLMHQLSRWRSQVPFSKNKGRVQAVAFHPKAPQLFVVTQTHIRVYDLQRQNLIKKVQANSRWISCIDIHPGGEHFIIGGFDRRVNWFEMEYTKRPHLMRFHAEAVRSIKFHRKYPLYASCSDDGRLVVSYGMVYEDYLKDPLIVPLKQLKGHKKFDDLYILDVAWHPYEPYLLSAGADATIRLWH